MKKKTTNQQPPEHPKSDCIAEYCLKKSKPYNEGEEH